MKVGDEVIGLNGFGHSHIYTVEAITPKGFIKVNGHLYHKDGSQRGSDGWYENTIYAVTPEEAQAIKRKNFIMSVVAKMHTIVDISYEQALEISKILEERELDG